MSSIKITDSDITDISHDGFTQERQYKLLKNYTKNVQYVLKFITDHNKLVAIASPAGVLLETPYFGPPTSGNDIFIYFLILQFYFYLYLIYFLFTFHFILIIFFYFLFFSNMFFNLIFI